MLSATLLLMSVTYSPATFARSFTVLHFFENGQGSAVPFGSVFQQDNWIYGTTVWNASSGSRPPTGMGGGSVYRLQRDGSEFEVLREFSPSNDGGALFHGLSFDNGLLVGVTKDGGARGFGTLFNLNPSDKGFTVLHNFGSVNDGRQPYSAPVVVAGNYFGLTFSGGHHGGGVLYSYDRTTANYVIRHHFELPGGMPFGTLTPVGDWLYGMVSDHRSLTDFGKIFRYRPDESLYEIVHSFRGGPDGGYPYDSLTWDGGEYLYGTTLGYYPFSSSEEHALRDEGVIFRLHIGSFAYEVLHDFGLRDDDGAKPNSAMLVAPDGYLYGIAHGSEAWGGNGYEYGTLYRLQPDGSDFEVLHTFDSMENGDTPMRSLLWHEGYLYGTTAFGGKGEGVGNGTVWRFSTVPVPEPEAAEMACVLVLIIVGTVAGKNLRRVSCRRHLDRGRVVSLPQGVLGVFTAICLVVALN